MSLAKSSHAPTNEVEEDEAIDIDSCSEKSLENIDEDAVVIPNEEEVTKKSSKVGRKRKSEVWQWFKTIEVNVKGPKGTMVKMNKAECTKCHKKYGVNSTDTPPEDDYFNFAIENQTEENPKTDLEVYLEEKVLVVGQGDNFNVLEWWKVNCVKYPILSLFARDILCIPISTVASESAFSAGGRVLDDYRSSLTKDMVELLVCGGDRIRASSTITMHTLQQAAKEEENLGVQIPMEKTD